MSQEQPSIRDRLRADLPLAIKARQFIMVMTIRSMLAAIDNAEAVALPPGPVFAADGQSEVQRRLLTDEDIREILKKEANARRLNLAEYEGLGRSEYADRLRAELAVFAGYLGKVE